MDKSFDLTVKRPQVLLFGNGLVRVKSWEKVINDLKDEEKSINAEIENIPYPLLSDIKLAKDDSKRWSRYDAYFNRTGDENHYPYADSYPNVELIAAIDFDAYLTTNYTYELENTLHPGYSKLKRKVSLAKTNVGKKDTRILINTYNSLCNNKREIWHIHGEIRNKSSLIFTQNDYGRLIGKITEANRKAGNKYADNKKDFRADSWTDYFIAADIYILGFGMSFFEIDLWWLLIRRLREKSGHGKIYFYELYDEKEKEKYKTLKALKVDVEHLGTNEISDLTYEDFYKKALKDIKKKMEEGK